MNKFYKINLGILLILLLALLIIGAHNLHAGCTHMFADCYLSGSDDWSIAWLILGSLFDISLLVLLGKVFMDGFVLIYVFIRIFILKTYILNNG
jgi:hypothetical protein